MADDITVSIELVRRAQSGDREALNRLFTRYYDRVRRIVRVRLGAKLRQHVDSGDILQDTFATAVTIFDRFEMRDEASLIRWLATLAERQITAAADRYTAQKRDKRREVPLRAIEPNSSTSAGGGDVHATQTGPLARIADAESTAILEECIRELPDEYRELIVWRDYAGAEWDIVARETGRPSAAAARMMHARAMVELAKLFRKRERS